MPPQDVDVLTKLGPSRTVEACQEPTNQKTIQITRIPF